MAGSSAGSSTATCGASSTVALGSVSSTGAEVSEGVITAASSTEAPDYTSGTEVSIKFVTDDGKVLLETKTTTFPQSANYYGLTSSGGTITMSYTVNTPGGTTVNPETGETVSIPGSSEQKSFTRRVEFTQE